RESIPTVANQLLRSSVAPRRGVDDPQNPLRPCWLRGNDPRLAPKSGANLGHHPELCSGFVQTRTGVSAPHLRQRARTECPHYFLAVTRSEILSYWGLDRMRRVTRSLGSL